MNERKYVVTIGTQGVDTLEDEDIFNLLCYAITKTKSADFFEGSLKIDVESLDGKGIEKYLK